MALRSVLDIEVNDDAFTKFYDKFQKYSEESRKLPAIFQRGALAQGTQTKEAERGLRFATEMSRAWDRMRETSGTVVRNVREIASRMLSITGSLSLITGAATGFGFLGMDVLGRSASGMRRASTGMGTSAGGMRAFQTNFSRFVDPQAFMGGVSNAMRDPRHWGSLLALGIRPGAGEDTSEVSLRALQRVQELAKATPESQLGSLIQSRKLGELGLGMEDVMRLRRMSSEELNTQGGNFRRDRNTFNLPDPVLRKWQDFTTQLERTGRTIETVFIKGLVKLTGPLTHLTQGFTQLVTAVMEKPELGKWITQLGDALESAAKYIASPQFVQDAEAFGKGLADVAKGIVDFATKVKHLFGGDSVGSPEHPVDPGPNEHPTRSGWAIRNGVWTYLRGSDDPPAAAPQRFGHFEWTPFPHYVQEWDNPGEAVRRGLTPVSFRTGGGGFNAARPGQEPGYFRTLEDMRGLPGGTLDAVWAHESGRGTNMVNPSSTARGHFQILEGTARGLGISPDDRFDLGKSSEAASRYLGQMMQQFHGSLPQALAGYAWGPGNVQKQVEQYGSHWREHISPAAEEFIQYVMRALGQRSHTPGREPTVNVRIRNETGGNAVMASASVGARA